ncbi:heavy metal translocating P-type ATPase [Anaerolineales bacterium HSG25]|nr:heavy metal translocating P-type ATPase [Anaerolineales bacterium HSG25]
MAITNPLGYGTVEQNGDDSKISLRDHIHRWSDKLELVFTIITLVAMVTAWLVGHYGDAAWVSNGLYLVAYVTGGWFGLKGGLASLRKGTIDVDLLMILAALGALYVGAPFEGAMLLFLFTLSNVLQDYALGRTRNAIKALMALRPDQALVRRGTQEMVLPLEAVALGDRFIIKPGDRIPLDGRLVDGSSSVDQASITGESLPVLKTVGETVFAGTINKNGYFEAEVTHLAHESTIAKLITLVEEARSQKAKTQRFLDTAEQYYAIGVILFTALVAVTPVLWGSESFAIAFYRAMTVMVAASPCALIISTPAAILSAIGNGARQGVLFKGGAHVEQAAQVKVVAFDKTGTLTQGQPMVTDIQPCLSTPADMLTGLGFNQTDPQTQLLALAASLEVKSEHPLGQAIVGAAQEQGVSFVEVTAFQAETGRGIEAEIRGQTFRVGSWRYFAGIDMENESTAQTMVDRFQHAGKTSIVVAKMGQADQTAQVLGVIAIADTVRERSHEVVQSLKAMGIEQVVMLTGDQEQVAETIAQQVGVDQVYAELLPADKVARVRDLQAQYGPVAMVGDGVNDAPALAQADLGIAMGAGGSDVALETADVVLLADELRNIPYLLALSQRTQRTLFVNLAFALTMIVLMIGAIFMMDLPLPLAVLGHEGGTVLVVLNGLTLLFYRTRRETPTRSKTDFVG